ncbi:MAG: hypothetical protein NC191_09995 [Muribaculaceae bacterium]|nr:hypothetical protein [Muribaculaceae bacterium]
MELEEFKLVLRTGVLMGQANPKQDPEKLVEKIIEMLTKAYLRSKTNEPD